MPKKSNFQLPLAGSPVWVNKKPSRAEFSFNSLSRDHRSSWGLPSSAWPSFSFNSLSRDHQRYLYKRQPTRPILLSTPSRGITSGVTSRGRVAKSALSTPSRGITSRCFPASGSTTVERTFNSLSRDHRAQFRDFSALRGFLPRHLFAQLISKATIWIYRFTPL